MGQGPTKISSRIVSVLNSLQELGEPIHVQGASTSARALIVAHWARKLRSTASTQSLVVICPTDDIAAELASDIETLSTTVYGESVSVCYFPGWDQSPYSSIAPSIRSRLARIAALGSLGLSPENGRPDVVVTTLAASCQSTLPPRSLQKFSLALRVGRSVESRESLIRKLLEAGYLRVDPVEDPGTFAVRGDIIDAFPPDQDLPLRIELFGDEVEKMRRFDPATQRAAADDAGISSVLIPPAREVLINSETLGLVRERLKAHADDAGIPRSVRDPVLASIQDGIYPDHSDLWGPFAYESPATFWDYVPSDWPVILDDQLSSQQEWDQFIDQQKEMSAEANRTGVLVPGLAQLYPEAEGAEKKVQHRVNLFLDRVEVANLEAVGQEPEPLPPGSEGAPQAPEEMIASHHRVAVKANTDLAGGTRHSLGDLEARFQLWRKQGFKILTLASTQSQLERIRFLLEERGFACLLSGPLQESQIRLEIGTVTEGFRWPAEGLVVLTESEILGAKHKKKQKRAKAAESGSAAREWSGLQALSDLQVNDAVVHIDHGIGLYQGLVRLNLNGAPSDFLLLEYANKDKLYLPVYRLNVIQKYVGSGETVALDKLGSQQFLKAKEKVRSEVKKLAIDLIQLYAERKVRPGIRFSPRDASFREFEAQFPFDETPDQLKAIDEAITDLESGRVMDRLVCGDVGYGKTEVAIRAAFKAVSDGKQVAVLVPTTVLAHQHEQSFKLRLKDYPLMIDSISRFKPPREQKRVLESVSQGKVDIVIGTHRLLSKDVKFNDLGLIIVDEEQRFGVEHKEKLKTLRTNTHVLTLTATPIPRTLHMALSGLRDISLMNTPPVDRLPIRTYVSKFDDSLIKRAIEMELNRGGQVFFVHNRVQSIYEIANRIRELVPQAQVAVGHGQMAEGELEKAMMDFYQKRANVLVCTSIIESGLDVPSANTIIVNRADAFGLAQLYQIRGRVGRSQSRAYAYLLLPAEGGISEDAKKRLEVIQKFVELGSGFSIASHDLEIRGGGDLLGAQQSGHIAAVGFDLYTELLEEAIRELQGKPGVPEESRREPEIKAPFPAFLSETYVPDVHQRLSLYRRCSAASQEADLEVLEEELRDRFGALPIEAQNLLWLIRIKQLLKSIGIDALTVGAEKVSLVPGSGSRLDPVRAISLVASNPRSYQLTPDSKFVAKLPTASLRDLYFALEGLFKDLLPRS